LVSHCGLGGFRRGASGVDDPTVEPLPPTDKKVGIDVGISSLLTTSDGDKIANPKHFNRLYQKLKSAQKLLSQPIF
jgi:putative transposase